MEMVDAKLEFELNKEEAIRMIKVALLCTSPSPALRPTMSEVVSMLEGCTIVDDFVIDPSRYGDELTFNALRDQFDHIEPVLMISTEAESLMHSSNATMSGSASASAHDLYLDNLASQ